MRGFRGATPPLSEPDGAYRPNDYWRVLHERGDISAVGQSGLPPILNRWLYRSWARSVSRFAVKHGLPVPGTRLYEVGAGTGYWVRFWRDRGVSAIDGCDLSPKAVAALNDRFTGGGTFSVADISELSTTHLGLYDLVECQNVLLHITDDERFDRALQSIARLVAPGGALLLAEPILVNDRFERPHVPSAASRARPIRRYATGLEAAGLQLVDIRGYAVVANNPIEGADANRYRLWRAIWMCVVALTRILPANARWLGPLLFGVDGVLTRTNAAPSGKLALFRRP